MIINSLDATHRIVQTPLCAKVLVPVILEPDSLNVTPPAGVIVIFEAELL